MQRIAEEKNRALITVQMEILFYEQTLPLITNEHIENADTAIYALGRISGEGADRLLVPVDYYLMEDEIKNLIFLGEHFKNVIVLLNVGGVIDEKQITSIPGIGAIIYKSIWKSNRKHCCRLVTWKR